MLKQFVQSALFISLTASVTYATTTEVDFNTTHVFPSKDVDKQYVNDALAPHSLSRWNYDSPLGTAVTIKYAFAGDDFGYVSGDDVQRNFHSYEKSAIVEELEAISGFTKVTFVEVFDVSDVNIVFRINAGAGNGASMAPRFASEAAGYNTVAYSETTNLRYLNPARETNYERFELGDIDYKHDFSRSKWMITHELGHALGLHHPFSVGENVAPFPLGEGDDHKLNTVMSYQNVARNGTTSSESYSPTSFKTYDIIALQHLYGKNENLNSSDNLYEFNDNYDFHQVINDTSGIDTISVANSERNNVIDLRGGSFSSIAPNPTGFYEVCPDGSSTGCGDNPHEHLNRSHNSLSIDVDTVIENATGGMGNDILVANAVSNELDGGDGVDTAIFAGNKADYIVEIETNITTITSVSDSEDVDTVTNVEFLKFADETVSLNQAPVISLPETVTVRETLDVVIDVTVTDAENDELTYTWTQFDGTDVTLSNADTLSVGFVAPAVDTQETINLQLEVSDGTNTVTSTVAVEVMPNNAPVITDVTADKTVDEATSVTLTVTATDADNDNLTYRWVVNGATVTLTGETTDTVTFTAPDVTSDTALTIQVFVSDGFDEVSSETRTVTVKNVEASTTTPATEAKPPEESKSSGGSFGYFILLIAGLRLFRK